VTRLVRGIRTHHWPEFLRCRHLRDRNVARPTRFGGMKFIAEAQPQ